MSPQAGRLTSTGIRDALISIPLGPLIVALLKDGNLFHIPTNAGWTEVTVGTGGVTQAPFYSRVITGATANSKGLLHTYAYLFTAAGIYYKVTFDKRLYFICNISRQDSDSEAVARLQLKSVNTEGALSAIGIGLRSDNYTLVGESYGTELGEVSLGVTLTTLKGVQIVIIHYPGSKIEWYVDGVLKGTQSTTSKIPSGGTASDGYLVQSIINGATGGTNARLYVGMPKIWQER